jgi:hypothetical protein
MDFNENGVLTGLKGESMCLEDCSTVNVKTTATYARDSKGNLRMAELRIKVEHILKYIHNIMDVEFLEKHMGFYGILVKDGLLETAKAT